MPHKFYIGAVLALLVGAVALLLNEAKAAPLGMTTPSQEVCLSPETVVAFGDSKGYAHLVSGAFADTAGRELALMVWEVEPGVLSLLWFTRNADGAYCWTTETLVRDHHGKAEAVVRTAIFSCQTPSKAVDFGAGKGYVLAYDAPTEDGLHEQLWQVDNDTFLLVIFAPSPLHNDPSRLCYARESTVTMAQVLARLEEGYDIRVQTFGYAGSGEAPPKA